MSIRKMVKNFNSAFKIMARKRRAEIAVRILQEKRLIYQLDWYEECPDCHLAGNRHSNGCQWHIFEELDNIIEGKS